MSQRWIAYLLVFALLAIMLLGFGLPMLPGQEQATLQVDPWSPAALSTMTPTLTATPGWWQALPTSAFPTATPTPSKE